MLTPVHLHGPLGDKYGRRLMLDVDSVAGAVALLKANFSEFARDLIGDRARYRVTVGKSTVGRDELANPARGQDIHITPVLAGAGDGDVWTSIAGIVLIIVGAVVAYYGDPLIGGYIMEAGIAMFWSGALSTVFRLLFSNGSKRLSDYGAGDKKASKFFNGPVNTTAQGNPVPVLYGRLIVGSQVISGGFSDEDAI